MFSRLEVYDTLVKHGELTFRELCVELGAWDIDRDQLKRIVEIISESKD